MVKSGNFLVIVLQNTLNLFDLNSMYYGEF